MGKFNIRPMVIHQRDGISKRVSLGQCHVAGRLRTILLISLRGGLSLIHEVDT